MSKNSDGVRNGIYLSSYGIPDNEHEDGDDSSPYLQVINNDKKLLYIDNNDFYLQDKSGETLKLDLNNGFLIAKKFTLDAINNGTGIYFSNEGSVDQPFLKIVSKHDDDDDDDKTLLYVDKDSFYLQSHDWSEDGKTGT
jgi:hypothetical protein